MIIRLGYVAISNSMETTNKTITYTNFIKDYNYCKIDEIIIQNLNNLEKLIDYNIKNNIHFFRLTSNLIPLATKDDINFDYINKYKEYYKRIGDKINYSNMRVDMHPSEYCVLNSTKKDVVKNTIEILMYHYKILEALNIKDKIIILHVGSNVLGKENSLKRFINNFNKLPDYLKKCIAVENDDKVFNINDCMYLHKMLGIKVILDYHHYLCNHEDENIFEMIKYIFNTFNSTPKIHFSSPKNKTKKEFRTHHDYIDINSFTYFLEHIKNLNIDFDIMLEAKAKDDALFRLTRQLKYLGYNFIDETTFMI